MEVNFPYVNVTKQLQGKMTYDLHFYYNILPNIRAPFIHRLQRERKVSDNAPETGIRWKEEPMSEFHRLIEREIPRLRRYARALTRSADRADDLVQETLMRAIAKGHLWQEGTDIRAWLFTIMNNQYVNMVRRAMRDGANVDIEQISSALVATTHPTASRQLHELERALSPPPGEHRAVILLVGLEGI